MPSSRVSEKGVAVPSDLPSPGKWDTAAINILVLRNDTIEQYPDLLALLSTLTIAAINRTNNDPARAEKITAAWVFGDEPILTLPKGLCTLRTGSTSSLNDLPQSRISSPSISPPTGPGRSCIYQEPRAGHMDCAWENRAEPCGKFLLPAIS